MAGGLGSEWTGLLRVALLGLRMRKHTDTCELPISLHSDSPRDPSAQVFLQHLLLAGPRPVALQNHEPNEINLLHSPSQECVIARKLRLTLDERKDQTLFGKLTFSRLHAQLFLSG